MITEQQGTHEHIHMSCRVKCLSWTAVFAGALTGVGLAFLLNLFSMAISISAFSINKQGAVIVAVGGVIAAAIGVIVAMFMAGLVAGYLGRPYCYKRNLGVLYGFTAWCLALLMMVFIAMPMQRYVSIYTHFMTSPSMTEVAEVATVKMMPAITGNASPAKVTAVVINNPQVPAALAIDVFVVFILFFLGALASCFGGHYGMGCRCDSVTCSNDLSKKRDCC